MIGFRKRETEQSEREKMARLEQAEADLRLLKDRARKAIQVIDDRAQRNHFAEALRVSMRGA